MTYAKFKSEVRLAHELIRFQINQYPHIRSFCKKNIQDFTVIFFETKHSSLNLHHFITEEEKGYIRKTYQNSIERILLIL